MQELVAKYLDGSCTQEEVQSVELWIENNPMEFEQYSSIWDKSKNFKYPKNRNSFSLIHEKIESSAVKIPLKPRFQLWKIAASLILLVAFSALVFKYTASTNKQEDLYSVTLSSEKNIQEFTLKDGTRIWLKPNSSLHVSDAFNTKNRKVKLIGEAFFDVSRNEEKPFTIEANGVNVKVLGTSFSVEENNQEVTVAVKTGKVSVASDTKETTLLPEQMATYKRNSNEFVFSKIKTENNWSWVNKVLIFENSELKDVILKIEETYNVIIEYNHSYEQTPFTGKFDNANLEDVLNILENSLNIKFKVVTSK